MRKTANYDLCQWDPEDRILREDFNSDNEKIDEAIAGANNTEKLLDITTQEEAVQVELSLEQVEWEKYRDLLLYMETRGVQASGESGYYSVYVTVDGVNGGYTLYEYGGGSRASGSITYIASAEFSSKQVRFPVLAESGICYPDDCAKVAMPQNITKSQNITILAARDDRPIPTGSRFILYGVKK